ncbi:MAG TPA: nitronate monooxygenase family protein [Acidimicrobiales bacterium]|jgi:NAD(P)H-dependent flavin oxidoreductase YrpB (nitropropane dioxygenase family)|nr:nitronate monooxygenase family protein [Acidimicrobiales bacterium]
MRTAVTEMFGIDLPIFAFSHCRDVVAAVTKAGGMGVLGAAAHSPEQLDIDLAWIEAEVGERPYGVDVIVPLRYVGAEEGGLPIKAVRELIPPEHVAFVDDILRRYEVPDLPDSPAGPTEGGGPVDDAGAGAGMIFSAERAEPQLDIALAYRTTLVVNALGPPTATMIERAKAEGRRIGALAGAVHHAERHVAAGVDLIVAQGYEAGGHTGEIATMVLLPEIVDAVGDTPVLGAGGIGRGRQMAAAMALGAAGVWCGSVWLTTDEAETNPVVKEKFLAAGSADTVRSRSRTGKPARQLRSAWTDEWDDPKTPAPLGMPMQPVLVDEALRRIDRAAFRKGSGAEKLANYFVGQVVGTMNRSKPAAQIVYDMVDEFIEASRSLARQLED